MVLKEEISMGHARVLSKLEDTEQMKELASKVTKNHMTVRELEDLTSGSDYEKKERQERHKKTSTSEYKYVEELLRDKLDTRVKIKEKKIEITFTSVADLNRILEILDVKE